ncbi:14632_t:CDS:2 [Racocetra fulgida]|uniref:14632_t:CDS:1 n=1 Tax=Racocetra fulgida TaxID=60492 RepID=A0A9N9A174_9GLOM|nr:14632_t:CDS:2 [Racocetra fulgida]
MLNKKQKAKELNIYNYNYIYIFLLHSTEEIYAIINVKYYIPLIKDAF